MVIVVVLVIVVFVLVDLVTIDADASALAAADPCADRGGVTAGPDDSNRSNLRNEDQVALGIGRHRMRSGRLRNGLDQDARPVDHAEHRRLLRRCRAGTSGYRAVPVRSGVVAAVAGIEPDLVGAGDVAD